VLGVCASAIENAIPATSDARTYRFHDIGLLLNGSMKRVTLKEEKSCSQNRSVTRRKGTKRML